MGSLGFPEMMLIFVIALIVFGPKRLPEIGRSIGKAMGEFKKATNEMRMTLEEEVRLEELKKIAADTTAVTGNAAAQLNTIASGNAPEKSAEAAAPAEVSASAEVGASPSLTPPVNS
jgi:TatA/E family protein of Tat protein translocase